MIQLKKKEFDLFRELVYNRLGISLSDQKVSMMQSRLGKLVHQKGLGNYMELYEYFVHHSGSAVDHELEDAITTNVTSFFREKEQWVYFKEYIKNTLLKKEKKKLRIWSSASSSGEEPYSIAIFLHENIPNIKRWDIKILATDISEEILKKAMHGVYSEKSMEGLSHNLIQKYFTLQKSGTSKEFTVNDSIKKMITFRKFNLVYGNYGMFSNPIDIIFCRNVMIYFDKAVQTQINIHLASLLQSGGLLFIGHSESIPPSVKNLKLVKSSIYMKQ
ncbi:MAG: protein-glutamate O-methyltransferase CheR [Sulfurimonas sp.]|nr:protein-glutamate O-methyltransferase CheR [Sulfurimonas sp.]